MNDGTYLARNKKNGQETIVEVVYSKGWNLQWVWEDEVPQMIVASFLARWELTPAPPST